MCFFQICWKTVPVSRSLIDKCLFTGVAPPTNWANKPTGSWSLLIPSSQFNRTSNIWLSYIHSRLKLLQLQNSYLNLLTVNFLAIQKWTEENLRRFLVLEVDETLPWIIWLFEENLVVIFNQLKFACYADKTYCCFFKSASIF